MKKYRDFHISEEAEEFGLPELPSSHGPEVFVEARALDGSVVNVPLTWDRELLLEMVVDAFRRLPDLRALAVAQMRCASWWMRYSRLAATERGTEAFRRFVEWRHVIEASGCPKRDVDALVGCLIHACTCDGCDLANGARMVRGEWLGGTGASSAP